MTAVRIDLSKKLYRHRGASDTRTMTIWHFLSLVYFCAFCCGALEAAKKYVRNDLISGRRSDEERLLEFLFEYYDPAARPVLRSNDTVQVQIQFCLMHIQDLNIRNQVLTSTGLLIMEWVDERLKWQEDTYHLKEVVIEARKLWVPEFAVINGADQIYGDYREFRAIISSDGLVHWEPGGVFRTMCAIDITFFPFDDQRCGLVFGAWSYHTAKMNLTSPAGDINLDSYVRNGEWRIVGTTAVRGEFAYQCCPDEPFSNVAFTVHMRRRYTFYVMNIILPSMVTSVLLLSIFFCPPTQKVQIGVVVLLSFRIFLLNVTDIIPKTSDHIPLLGIYLTCTMAITTLSMVLTVLVLNLHATTERPVPYWLHVLAIQYMGRLLCKCQTVANVVARREKQDQASARRRGQYSLSASDDETDPAPVVVLNGKPTASSRQRQEVAAPASGGQAPTDHDSGRPAGAGSPSRGERTSAADYSGEWQVVAEVVDRLFFWTFLMAIIAVSLLLFQPMTKDYFTRRFNDT